jgi:hypothetical protein
MSGNPPTERLISVDIETEVAEPTTLPPHSNTAKEASRAAAKINKAVGGEVNGNCIVDEGYDTIQTYQGNVLQ